MTATLDAPQIFTMPDLMSHMRETARAMELARQNLQMSDLMSRERETARAMELARQNLQMPEIGRAHV